jgi:hypothetical protein
MLNEKLYNILQDWASEAGLREEIINTFNELY